MLLLSMADQARHQRMTKASISSNSSRKRVNSEDSCYKDKDSNHLLQQCQPRKHRTSVSSASVLSASSSDIACDKNSSIADIISPRSLRYARRSSGNLVANSEYKHENLTVSIETKLKANLKAESSAKPQKRTKQPAETSPVSKEIDKGATGHHRLEQKSEAVSVSKNSGISKGSPSVRLKNRPGLIPEHRDTRGQSSVAAEASKQGKCSKGTAVSNTRTRLGARTRCQVSAAKAASELISQKPKESIQSTSVVTVQQQKKHLLKSKKLQVATVTAPSEQSQSSAVPAESNEIEYVPVKKRQRLAVEVPGTSGASKLESLPQDQQKQPPLEVKRRRYSLVGRGSKHQDIGGLGAHGQPSETTGSCASSKRRSAASKHSAVGGAGNSIAEAAGTSNSAGPVKLSAMSSLGSGRDDSYGGPHDGQSQNQGAMAAAGVALQTADASVNQDAAADASASGGAVGAGSFVSLIPNLDQDANDVGRLQALLEARGLPSHLLGALGPRMHHLLLRSTIGGSVSKAQQLLQGLQAKDEGQQIAAVMEMCQLLVMGNEDTLAGFPIKQVVPALITLLQMEHNFDIMHHACRALTYMMEALPRSTAVVVDAVPVFLEKLQAIQCMDVAEQALQALEMLSKKHNKAILHANGVLACLTYVDFFSMPAQRNALAVTANCCQNLTPDEFHYIQDALPLISTRLTSSDKKSMESVCLCMARLVDNYCNSEKLLNEIASHGLLASTQQLVSRDSGDPRSTLFYPLCVYRSLKDKMHASKSTVKVHYSVYEIKRPSGQSKLMMTPQVISTGMFVTVIRMLVLLCSNCPDLAVVLLKQNIAETLCYLLVGPSDQCGASQTIDLVQRTPQELYEIVSLIGELMPKLPSDGLFAIDSMLRKNTAQPADAVQWHWLDDHGMWHPYSIIDSRIIEAAHQSGEHEVNLSIFGGNYTVDFDTMQQINDDTGTARHVQRKANLAASSSSVLKMVMVKSDSREDIMHEESGLASNFIKTLFGVLYEVYSSSAGPSVRHKCLQAIMRMIYYASPDLLRTVLASSNVSSHVAAMMASPDLKIVVASIQMANILMEKLPDVFSIYFCREGVVHQIKKLCEPEALDLSAKKSAAGTSAQWASSPADLSLNEQSLGTIPPPTLFTPAPSFAETPSSLLMSPPAMYDPTQSSGQASLDASKAGAGNLGASSSPSPRLRLSSVLKHKKPPKRNSRKPSKSDPSPPATVAPNVVPNQPGVGTTFEVYNSLGDPFLGFGSGASPSSTVADVTPPPAARGKWGSGSKSSFLSGLHPSRWGRAGASTGHERPSPLVPTHMSLGLSQMLYHDALLSHHRPLPVPPSCSSVNVVDNREKIKQWISEQAMKFSEKYYGTADAKGANHPAMSVLNKLCSAISSLSNSSVEEEVSSLVQIRSIVTNSDMSPFEVIHSGLVGALLTHLTVSDIAVRNARLCRFLQVFLNLPGNEIRSSLDINAIEVHSLSCLVAKLINCFHHLEQFQVKVHDLPGGSNMPGRSSSALKFFDTHQLKCNLQRHASCTNLKQWHGGPVKIDPLALVQAIERYLVMRGYGRVRQNADNDGSEDDDASDDDIDDTMAAMSLSQSSGRHRIELLINDHVLPYGMTVYEAVKQFGNVHERGGDNTDTDTDTETPFGSAAIWINTHTIWYRLAPETDHRHSDIGASPKKSKSSDRRRHTPSSKSHRNSGAGSSSSMGESSDSAADASALTAFLTPALPPSVNIKDPSLEVLALLRLVHALSRYWSTLYDHSVGLPLLSQQEFVSSKLTAKVNRQLQDPLVIMTGNMPQWLSQIGRACPFLLPFDTRLSLFYATTFDRDRAMHRLQDTAHENTPSDGTERVAPRLERKKCTVSRDDILKQAEKVLSELGSSRAILEIQYENEVGTGLGPTLEFYSLVSHELQRMDLELWRGDPIKQQGSGKGSEDVTFVYSPCGLFPLPMARNAKLVHVNKIKAKFRFLGKFMAKALMDSRMLDLPLSEVFYKWMLGQEHYLQSDSMRHICPILARSLDQLHDVVRQRKRIEMDKSHTSESRQLALDSLTLTDSGTIEDLDLDFILPGYPQIELKKGGKDQHVTLDNLDEYLKLVTRWTLTEGTQRQFEAFREGFESVFPLSSLTLFYPEELDQLFCGNSFEPWSVKYLMEACRPDHGYTLDSQAIRFLFTILSSYDADEQRMFLQFMTGSPRLPVGGLKSLNPQLTIVRKTVESNENPDDFLPSVMTCVNYLKLPDYSTIDVMKARLSTAAREGQLSFHLS